MMGSLLSGRPMKSMSMRDVQLGIFYQEACPWKLSSKRKKQWEGIKLLFKFCLHKKHYLEPSHLLQEETLWKLAELQIVTPWKLCKLLQSLCLPISGAGYHLTARPHLLFLYLLLMKTIILVQQLV
jgi:hypothetical protein